MNVLVACEESGTVRDAFIAAGHKAVSCDLKPARNGGPHYRGNLFDITGGAGFWCEEYGWIRKWDLLIAHPPCTYLTVSANKWLKDQPPRKSGALVGAERRQARIEAIEFFMRIVNLEIDHICIENPIGCMSSVYRKPDQTIQPYQFGDDASKATCLWLKSLPILLPTTYVYPRMVDGKQRWANQTDSGQNNLPPSSDRAEIRSKTYSGIADAMADQWTRFIDRPTGQQRLF